MREARNDEVPYYASRMHSASSRLAISALRSGTNPPVCARFAHLDWGYEAFSPSGAGKRVKNSEADPPLPRSEAILKILRIRVKRNQCRERLHALPQMMSDFFQRWCHFFSGWVIFCGKT